MDLPQFDDIFDLEQRPSAGVRYWARVVALQSGRVREANRESLELKAAELAEYGEFRADDPAAERLHAEVHFLLIAVRHVVRFHAAIARVVPDERLTEARSAFERSVSDPVRFRDFYEHLDEYVLGRGRLTDTRHSPVLRRKIGSEAVWVHFADTELHVLEAAEAARQLADTTAEVWDEALERAKPRGLGPPPDDGRPRYLKVHLAVSDIIEDGEGRERSVGVLRGVEISEEP